MPHHDAARALGAVGTLEPVSRRILPKELVHKAHEDGVLLADWRPAGPETHRVLAEWPRGHGYYAPRHGLPDPLLVTETIRQAGLLVCHVGLDVPFGQHFVWNSLEVALGTAAAAVPDGRREVAVDVRCADVVRRGSRVSRADQHFTLHQGGEPIATATARVSIQTPQVYQRLRGNTGDAAAAAVRALPAPPPIPPHRVGRRRPEDVVLSAASRIPGVDTGGKVWRLRLDPGHPIHFDHPVDHVPGSAMLDAARQAVQAFCHPAPVLVVAMECDFRRFVELDRPCLVEAIQLPADRERRPRVRVLFRQDGPEPSGTIDVTVVSVPPTVATRDAVLASLLDRHRVTALCS